MVSYDERDACDACGVPRGRWRAVLGMTLCGPCERTGGSRPGREPVLLAEVLATTAVELTLAARTSAAVPDPRTARTTACKQCGAPATWHRTVRGRWILIEPGDRPLGAVPAGKRWRIAGDGTAVNLGSSSPSDTCRISHFDLCPARSATAGGPGLPRYEIYSQM
ncbi:hypothetical protein J7E91_14580 [Streptomyces sp. ISL-99]|uniref:DUF6083 domain-containing protein n=1 Tax=Streptomyces sp. ISL-99 TaxID=2819193 RepID=UPI001BE6C489|nr:DUF6083 domain-containing protein [Streptomyces sp. ISL-99]MBT2526619.1 hypothetical protein [Streptomyces sp. ISL-99]